MKKAISFLLIVITILGLTGCNEKTEAPSTDALKFKEEYESINGETNAAGKEYRSISIDENNPFEYKEAEEIVEMINNKETFAVYFGFDTCPWCRSVVPTLVEVAKDLEINKIYYVDVKNIRDVIEINDNGELETTTKGTDGYYELIKALDNVLSDYTLTDKNGNTVSANEKRIFAPNVVVVVNGQAEKIETGISDKQTDGYQELTDEMKKDTYDKFDKILDYFYEKLNSCDKSC